MLKRRLNGKTIGTLFMLIMSVCLSTFAALRTEEWTLNPSDYRYDMSLYFTMSSRDYEDLTKYEIGAFIGDECRGLAEKLDLPDNGSCLYMRIRSNTPEGDEIEFRMRDRSTGETVVLKGKDGAAFQFKADQRVGLPSDPYVMMRYFNVTVEAGENGTVAFENGLYAEGTVIDLTAVPSEGYHFVSWSDGSTDAQRKLTVNGDVELSASFAVTAYKVVFKIGENVIATLDVDYGSTIAAPEAPALEGHTFGGWADLPATMPAHDIEITGSYTLTIYKAVFKIDNEVVTTLDLAFGAKVEAPAAPAKEGYTFDGWVGVPETMPANDIEVTGNYTTNIYKIAFRIGEEVVSMVELPFGSPIETPAVPEITGYTFEGWADVPATVPAKDLEITGSYAVNKYKAVFKIGDEVVSTVEVAYGEAIEAPTVADKEGHTFSGWTNLPATMPANDVEITGTYTAGTYEAIFKIGDEVIATIRASFGSELEIPAAPEKEGYTFAGWADLPATMPARDLEIIGSYTVNVYKAVFKLGEEVLTVLEVPYGEAVAAPAVPEKEGHTFDGWFTIPETMPGNDIEVLGSYVPNVYKAIFKIGDEVISTLDVVYGSTIEVPAVPEVEGYTFSGWTNLPATMPAGDLEITGAYTAGNYEAIFKIGDEVIATIRADFGSPIEAPAAPEKEGHTFAGWAELPATMPAKDIEITGSYNVNVYKAVFKIGEDVIATLDVDFGAKIDAPAAPESEGQTFSGWYLLPETMPAQDLEITGNYVANIYKAVFKIGDEVISTVEVPFGSVIETPVVAAVEGYTFAGWTDVPETMPAKDIEISGSYDVNSYKVVFKVGDEVISTVDVAYGATIEAPSVPEMEGYTFSGWILLPETMPAQDLEITGSYNVNIYKAVFKIGDETVSSLDLAYGATVEAPAAPEIVGYTFNGWGEVPATMPAQDIELTGSYTVNTYTVVFKIGDETLSTIEVAYGAEFDAPTVPEKEGHTFSGWTNLPATMPANDIEVTGSYTAGNYEAVFKIGDEVIAVIRADFGSIIEIPNAPAKDGYTFSGWGDVPATMPAKNIEITGSYIANVYNAVFKIGDEILSIVEVPFGEPIVAPAVPEKEGYTFDGWFYLPETMPGNDIEVVASYVVNVYKATFKIGDEVISTVDVAYGEVVEAPIVPEKEGHTFSGWTNLPATMPAGDVEITGAYTAGQFEAVFKIGDEVIAVIRADYGTAIEIPAAPEKEGHTFNGWADVPATMPGKDIEITGSYTVNVYKAVFKIDEEVISTVEVAYGDVVKAPAAPAKEGYTFDGWFNLPETMPAQDIEIAGHYAAKTYRLTFYIDDEVYMTTELTYGSAIEIPNPVAPDNMKFDGWKDEIPATMPDHDVDIHGSYSYLQSAIGEIAADDDELVTVYNLNGILLYKDIPAAEAKERLTPGLYIINGKKVLLRAVK